MTTADDSRTGSRSSQVFALALGWLAVGVPLLWGVVQTLKKAMALFH